ncbi:hypothetical protein MTQ10_25380 [Streptomyces sp. XM83C]|uniref:hypothetical protein n=1 Tax=Streptomyces sp. XM83C TaxID=2929781 RepID=UPI001FF74325|nr:hypothetical protein [Streptomyces sp. XM83C]MCK1822841.1 hypothetical protein [Streptomyces sp. XM83C]
MSDTTTASEFRRTAAVRPWQSLASLGVTDSDLATVHHVAGRFPYPAGGPDARHHHDRHQHRKGV